MERNRRLGYDFIKFQPRATCFAEAFGNVYQPSGHRLKGPILQSHAVNQLEDWGGLQLVNPAALDDQVESLRLVCAEVGPEVPVIQTVFSPISVAGYLVGKDYRRAARELRRNPELVMPALERVGQVLGDFAQRSVAAGAAGVFYAISGGYASSKMMPREVYDRLLLPLDQSILTALPEAAWFNVLHICGSHIYLDVARQLPVHVASWSTHNQGNPGLREGQELTGKPVMGGLGQRTTVLRGSPAAIMAEVRAAVAETGGRGVLVAPGCSVPPMARESNLKAISEAQN